MSPEVKAAFDALPSTVQPRLADLRALILEVAAHEDIPVTETLKWGQPSYLAPKGSTLRLGLLEGQPALFAHCQSKIIPQARDAFGDGLSFSGNRAVILDEKASDNALRQIIKHGLTYHQKSG